MIRDETLQRQPTESQATIGDAVSMRVPSFELTPFSDIGTCSQEHPSKVASDSVAK